MLKPKRIGRKIFHFKSIGSTNKFAKSLVLTEGKEFDGTVVIANEQMHGKGRRKRHWVSPWGGVYLSLVLHQKDTSNAPLLNVLTAVPLAKSLKKLGIDCKIKWPNDIVIGDRKVGGILGELVSAEDESFSIIGFGLNTNLNMSDLSGKLKGTSTTVKNELGHPISNIKLIESFLREYESFYNSYMKGEYEKLLRQYRGLSSILGEQVTVKSTDKTIQGLAADILKDGALLVKVGMKDEKILEGDVLECRTKV